MAGSHAPIMTHPLDFTGKTVLITGASRGIGRAIAEAFHENGATVYGTGRSLESASWMTDAGMHPLVYDLTNGDPAELIRQILERQEKIDCLINNAGISSSTPASGFKEPEVSSIIDTNFKGLFFLCQAYYKTHKRTGGNIINVASVLGMVTTLLASIYSGTKGAVLQLTKSLALEWASSGFRVNAICPGFIDTDMTSKMQKRQSVMDHMMAQLPLKRLGKPEEMAGAALFLASDLSSYMTGQSIVIDGGLTLQ